MENKRYHIVIASIVFAVLTWTSVNMRYDYTAVTQMPVILENLKAGKALRFPVPKHITARFRGNGWLIAGLYLSPGLKYFIDVSSVGSEHFMITGRDLPEHVKLPFALQLVDIQPETLHIALDDYLEKRVPVVSRVVVDFHEGFGQIGKMRCLPESVRIGGAREHMEVIHEWPTVYTKFADQRSSIDAEIPLEEPSSFSLNVLQKAVRIMIDVQPYAEKTFSGLPVNVSGLPSRREVVFIPPRMEIIVRGGIDELSRLTNADFDVTLPYESLIRDDPEYVVPGIVAPQGVRIVGRNPEKLQFIIRKRL